MSEFLIKHHLVMADGVSLVSASRMQGGMGACMWYQYLPRTCPSTLDAHANLCASSVAYTAGQLQAHAHLTTPQLLRMCFLTGSKQVLGLPDAVQKCWLSLKISEKCSIGAVVAVLEAKCLGGRPRRSHSSGSDVGARLSAAHHLLRPSF